jgi:CheY-like chemotaxis protein
LTSELHRGSVFRVTFPIARTQVPVEFTPVEHDDSLLRKLRVLVIDDDESVLSGMSHLLKDWGCWCDAANSIDVARAMVAANTPDLIISDFRLREHQSGIEAIEALRTLLGQPVPALLITGDTSSERLREAKMSGLSILHKPLSPRKLYSGLVALLPV